MSLDTLKILTNDENGKDIIEFFEKILEGFHLPVDLNFFYVSNSKQKQLIKLSKIADAFSIGLKCQLMVTINEIYYDSLPDDIKTILISQEINRIEYNSEKGTIKLGKPNFVTSTGIVTKFGYEEVDKAIETEQLLEKQLNEKNKEKKENSSAPKSNKFKKNK